VAGRQSSRRKTLCSWKECIFPPKSPLFCWREFFPPKVLCSPGLAHKGRPNLGSELDPSLTYKRVLIFLLFFSSFSLPKESPPLRNREITNEASLALFDFYFAVISFCMYSDPSGRLLSNKFCPSAVFEYLFFRDGKVRFEGILGSGDRCFKEPKPSRDLLELTGLSVPQQETKHGSLFETTLSL